MHGFGPETFGLICEMGIFPRYSTGTTYLIMTLWMASRFNVPYLVNVEILSLINVTGELLQFCQSSDPGGILCIGC